MVDCTSILDQTRLGLDCSIVLQHLTILCKTSFSAVYNTLQHLVYCGSQHLATACNTSSIAVNNTLKHVAAPCPVQFTLAVDAALSFVLDVSLICSGRFSHLFWTFLSFVLDVSLVFSWLQIALFATFCTSLNCRPLLLLNRSILRANKVEEVAVCDLVWV
jgi:hypothetical protein